MPKPAAPPPPKVNWRLWLRLAAWSGLFVGVAWGGREVHSFLVHDSRFELNCETPAPACATLQVRGAVFASPARLASVFQPDFGRSVFEIPLAERRRHLLAIDWVRSASVARIWPNRLLVTVSERTPVAFAKIPLDTSARHRMALVDGEGVLLALPPRSHFHLPVISGLTDAQTEEQRMTRVKAMQHLLDDLGPQAPEISEINTASVRDLRVIADIDGHGVELWLGDQHFRARYQNFMSHYAAIRSHTETASVFDLRLDDRILEINTAGK